MLLSFVQITGIVSQMICCIHSWHPPIHIYPVQGLVLQNLIWPSCTYALLRIYIAFRIWQYHLTWSARPHMNWPLLISPSSFHSMPAFAVPALVQLVILWMCCASSLTQILCTSYSLCLESFPPVLSTSNYPSHHSPADTPQSLPRPSWLDQSWISCSHSTID